MRKRETFEHLVVFQPSGRRGFIAKGENLKEASRKLGVDIEGACGDAGVCGTCRVKIEEGSFPKYGIESKRENLSPMTEGERRYIDAQMEKDGFRLACEAELHGDVVVFVPEESRMGKQVVVQAFDMEDKGPSGRVTSLQKMLPLIDRGGFESILVDTSVMSLPFTAFSLVANRLIKEDFGLPVGCAPSNGTYMFRKALGEEGRSKFPPVDAAIQAITALESDFVFYGPMSGTARVFASVSAAMSLQAALVYAEQNAIPDKHHPLSLLFPEALEQLQQEKGEQ